VNHAPVDPDWPIRLAAFGALRTLTRELGPVLPWRAIERGFVFNDAAFLFANQTKGIFRPAGMGGAALSIKTTVPRTGPRKYDDIAVDGAFSYALQRRDVGYHDNHILLRAMELGTPLVYLFGIEPGYYRPIWPVYVAAHDAGQHSVSIVAADADEIYEPGTHVADGVMRDIVRRYSTVQAKKRLHQDLFRHLVIGAYEERCSVCRLPRRELLQAAHITPDADARGHPVVSNGLALCGLHHSAYDADLLGIRPDYVIEIASTLLDARDGPTLEHGLKGFAGKRITLPKRLADRPTPSRLESRYESFRKSA